MGPARCGLHITQGIFRPYTQRDGADIINLSVYNMLATLVGGPWLLWQLLWVLCRTHRMCCYYINPVIVFQEHSGFLSNPPSPSGWCSGCSYAPNLLYLSRVQLLAFVPGLGHQLPDCHRMSAPYEQGRGKTEDCLRLLQTNPNVFPHFLTPRGSVHDHLPISFPLSSNRVNPFRMAQWWVQRVNS